MVLLLLSDNAHSSELSNVVHSPVRLSLEVGRTYWFQSNVAQELANGSSAYTRIDRENRRLCSSAGSYSTGNRHHTAS